jgi:protein-tyrosine-phosphatase
MTKFRIIFICRHNVFRSRVAEAYFKQINKNKNIEVSSGGLIKGKSFMNLSKNEIIAIKEENIKFISQPKNLTTNFLAKQNLTIIVANDVPISLFNNKEYNKKVVQWKIPDVLDNDKEKSLKTIRLIKNKVQQLVGELKWI